MREPHDRQNPRSPRVSSSAVRTLESGQTSFFSICLTEPKHVRFGRSDLRHLCTDRHRPEADVDPSGAQVAAIWNRQTISGVVKNLGAEAEILVGCGGFHDKPLITGNEDTAERGECGVRHIAK